MKIVIEDKKWERGMLNNIQLKQYLNNPTPKIGTLWGRYVYTDENGVKRRKPLFGFPHPDPNQAEAYLIMGKSGSGKTVWALNQVLQKVWFEGYSAIIIDNKGIVNGTNIPNLLQIEEIFSYGIYPMFVDVGKRRIIAPHAQTIGLRKGQLLDFEITDLYKIPSKFITLPLISTALRLPPSQSRESIGMKLKNYLAEKIEQREKVGLKGEASTLKIAEIRNAIEELKSSMQTSNQQWFDSILTRLDMVEKYLFDDTIEWSVVGKALANGFSMISVRFIGLKESADSSVNQAIFSAIMEEIKELMHVAKRNNINKKTLLFVDELQYYAPNGSDKEPLTKQIRDFLNIWRRNLRIPMYVCTQYPDQIAKTLTDSFDNKTIGDTKYDVLVNALEPGKGMILDRISQKPVEELAEDEIKDPRKRFSFFPLVEFFPPLSMSELDLQRQQEYWYKIPQYSKQTYLRLLHAIETAKKNNKIFRFDKHYWKRVHSELKKRLLEITAETIMNNIPTTNIQALTNSAKESTKIIR